MSFYTEVIRASSLFHAPKAIRDLSLLEPVLRAAVPLIIADAKSIYGVTVFVTETYRSPQRQQALFRQKLTRLNGLTPATIGAHHMGVAADWAKMLADGTASWKGDWSFLRKLAVKNGLISGLDWGLPGIEHDFVDPDHIQSCTLEQQDALFAGTWYPS